MMISKGKVGMVSGTKAMLRVASTSQHGTRSGPTAEWLLNGGTIASGIHLPKIYYPRLWGWQHHTAHHGCMQACIYDGGGASAAPCTWGCMFGIEYNGLPSCLRHLLVIA